MTPEDALAELGRSSGSQFDPAVVDAFEVTLRAPARSVEESRPEQRVSSR